MDDVQYLRTDQYRDGRNLNARIALHQRFSSNQYGWMRWVFDQLDLPATSCILEIGPGPGGLWAENRARIPAGWAITLADFSPGMIGEARRALGGDARFRFVVSDAQAIPFPAAQFDAVIANHMLYHVPDRARALAEIRRVLRPGGRVYAATNGAGHLREIEDLLDRFDSTMPYWRAVGPQVPTASGSQPTAGFFDLEHGGEEIARWFAAVEMRRYEDALVVTQAEPLVAYILSTISHAAVLDERAAALRRFIEQDLAAHGAIHISKDSGLFIAR